MLNFELCRFLIQLTCLDLGDDRALDVKKAVTCRVGQGAHRNDRKAWVELARDLSVARLRP